MVYELRSLVHCDEDTDRLCSLRYMHMWHSINVHIIIIITNNTAIGMVYLNSLHERLLSRSGRPSHELSRFDRDLVTWTRSTIAILSKDSDNAEDDSQARSTPNLLININTLY